MKQLFRYKEFTAAFDSFLEIPALLNNIRISILHKIIAIRCDEVYIPFKLLRYINLLLGGPLLSSPYRGVLVQSISIRQDSYIKSRSSYGKSIRAYSTISIDIRRSEAIL